MHENLEEHLETEDTQEKRGYAPFVLGSGGTGGASVPEPAEASSSSASIAAARFIASASLR